MLPQNILAGSFDALGAGVISLGATAVAGLIWFLMQQGVFGFKTLNPGDHAYRTLLGRPIRYHKSPKSLFFVAIVFDLHKVSSYRNVHGGEKVDLVIHGVKLQPTVFIHSFVKADKVAVRRAIFNLGDSARSHETNNARTRLIEQHVLRELTIRARSANSWEYFDTDGIADAVNTELMEVSGSYVEWIQLTNVAPSEGQIVSTAINALGS